ncbi:MAG: hypothetical protein ACTHNU_00230 [Gaiellales bacterium]
MSRRALAGILVVIAVILAIGGIYEYNQKVTCGPGSKSTCTAGKRRHPRRAEALWVISGVLVVVAGGLLLTDRR